jgi:hypothetical protein
LLLALAIVNRLRDKLSYRFWRRAHYLNFAVWVGSTLHGMYTGHRRPDAALCRSDHARPRRRRLVDHERREDCAPCAASRRGSRRAPS